MKHPLFKWLFLSALLILLSEIGNSFFDVKTLIYKSLSEQLTHTQIEEIFNFQKKWDWLGYILVPVLLLIKTSTIASIIYIGLFFSNKDLKFNTILNFVLKAEFIFLLVPVFKIIWFYFFQTHYTLEDIQYFYPLSALNITGYKGVEVWFVYPFQVLNLFELLYILYLGFEIGKLTQTNTDYGLKIVAFSYVPSLLLWIATVMFFTLNNA